MAACTYGAEIQVPTQELLDEFEAIQRETGRRVLKGHAKVAKPSMTGDLGWMHPKLIFYVRSITYWGRLSRLPQERLVRRIFDAAQTVSPPLPWFDYTGKLMHNFGIGVLEFQSVSGEALKRLVKKKVQAAITAEWRSEAKGKHTLRYMAKDHKPRLGKFLDGSASGYWLHRARTDTLLTNARLFPGGPEEKRNCPTCTPKRKESLEHLLIHCPRFWELRKDHLKKLGRSTGIDMLNSSDETLMEVILGFHPDIKDQELKLQKQFIQELVTARGIPLYSFMQNQEDQG